ncbi:ABC-F family ATP-binding cassette domain-containing protein [Pedobacter montanisoli]|uniref:ATP-binding cassette domain-containing protein n=1 Tax=Pedobacter montanisoli TaxID=2923277 RepID=A0ABS9ZT78_9SPHI|nr:ABC-F family ATP-binding cassette domain-containing protein [Pedobacter montanisoli]MCJ0741582.1 ATP-binding cassette domain-containing protein [Pedobacter montanisoli]
MLTLQNISYIHPNKDLLFENINLNVNDRDKIALIGNNGSGKSTLLKIIAKVLQPSSGSVIRHNEPYYIPQVFGQYNHLSIGQALQVEDKLIALHEVLKGNVTEDYLNLLNDNWDIEDRCAAALTHWQLTDLDLSQPLASLSGGQKTKVFLAGISIHQPKFILLDEPSNHLDRLGRQKLYDLIQSTAATLIVVSHDRELLAHLNTVCELSQHGITTYGGSYDFYVEQKETAKNALNQHIHHKERLLRKAKEKQREILEKQQKLDAKGKGKQEKAGIARIMMNTLKNNAENSSAKLKSVHQEKISNISQELQELRSNRSDIDQMKFGFNNSGLHTGKILFKGNGLNFNYHTQPLWKENLDIQIHSGERIAIKGSNGSGKTTLIKLILGTLHPSAGEITFTPGQSVYIDQDYSLIGNELSVYDQAQLFNTSSLQEHEIKVRLNRFLFGKNDWDKPCHILSGGERMRLMLCCLIVQGQSPDTIILDEPTNNLDIQNIEILTAAINEYQGTLIVVSHDEIFLKQINTERVIQL